MRTLLPVAIVVALLLAAARPSSQSPWAPQRSPSAERLRAIAAVSEKVAWASGNHGTVLKTTDGGAVWAAVGIPDAASLDFRDVEAFDDRTAFVLSIGEGERSRIYKTSDGGRTWLLQFTNPDPKGFYDAIAFWDRERGLAVGDPVDGRASILRTTDGGRLWQRLAPERVPPALPGDGAFAASGTCLVTSGKASAWFGTGGGAKARVFRTADAGETWKVADTRIAAGRASAGIFSLAFADEQDGIAVGGDYREETAGGDNIQLTTDSGETWNFLGSTRLRGFRSAAAYVPGSHGRIVLVVGPAGTDRSDDHGRTWTPLADEGYHAVSIEPRGRVAWAVGEQGRVAKLILASR